MTDDVSRETFNPKKHYRKVIIQQGRIIIDSDLNEQSDIIYHHDTAFKYDIIGKSGTNYDNCGFNIEVAEDEDDNIQYQNMLYKIRKGRYYVDGILCENEENTMGNNQPDLVSYILADNIDKAVPLDEDKYIAYLDVWERHVTTLDDPNIRESALGGPDTSTRSKIVWQVKLHQIKNDKLKVDDSYENDDFNWALSILEKEFENELKKKGRLSAGLLPSLYGKEKIRAYNGQNNVLYRVEIHNRGYIQDDKKNFTYKWARDNATVVSKVIDIDATTNEISVSGFKDSLYNFQSGDWVEITDDRHQLWRLPGVMVKLSDVISSGQGFIIVYDPKSAVISKQDNYYFDKKNSNSINNKNFKPEFNPIIRKWNYYGRINNNSIDNKDIPKEDNQDKVIALPLENGIVINFSKGFYETGDYWLIPARTFKKDIEWPKNNDKSPKFLKPIGPIHNYSPLSIMEYHQCDEDPICDLGKIKDATDDKEKELGKLKAFIGYIFNIEQDKLEINNTTSKYDDFIIELVQIKNNSIKKIFNVIYNGMNQKTILTLDNNSKIFCGFVTRNGKIYRNTIHNIVDLRRSFRNITDCISTTGIAKIIWEGVTYQSSNLIFGHFKHYLNVNTPPAVLLDYINVNKEKISINNDGSDDITFNYKAILIDKETFCISISLIGKGVKKLEESLNSLKFRWWAIPSIEKREQEKGSINEC